VETDIRRVIKAHWKQFAWMWLFPLAILASALVPESSGDVFFYAVALPAFFLCFYMASKPVRNREISVGHGMIFTVVVPIVLWATLIFGLFGMAMLLNPHRG